MEIERDDLLSKKKQPFNFFKLFNLKYQKQELAGLKRLQIRMFKLKTMINCANEDCTGVGLLKSNDVETALKKRTFVLHPCAIWLAKICSLSSGWRVQ